MEQCAEVLLVSRTTLWRCCQELGLSVNSYSTISNSELDAAVQRLTESFPRSGYIMIWGHLRAMGVHVTRQRVRETLLRVSASSVQLRRTTTVRRREYNVPSSNALWHIDGRHCLVRWRIVIHGGIDGYSRAIVYLKASDNNRSETVLQLFLEATAKFGWPSRVRSDLGGENIDVARAMIAARGLGRSSHIAGSSTHNQRIERLWRDTFRCVCHSFYSLFYEMEECGLLKHTSEAELFALHYVFMPRLNSQLSRFAEGWNNHPLRTEHGLSPKQLWTRGACLASDDIISQPEEYGIYTDASDEFDAGSVVIPETSLQLTAAQFRHIASQHNPLAPSEYMGLDVYISVCETVFDMLNSPHA